MKIYTNENNVQTLKLLIAAKLTNQKVDLIKAVFTDDIFQGPRHLPLLVVNEELKFFSTNAALQYLYPLSNDSLRDKCHQLLEWEATRLYPAVMSIVLAKSPAADAKQFVNALLDVFNVSLGKNKHVLDSLFSLADIAVWCSLYPLYCNEELKTTFFSENKNILRWLESVATEKAIQEALKEWGGQPKGPFSLNSPLGLPQLANLSTPVSSPDVEDPAVAGPTAEEVEEARDSWKNGLERLQPPMKQDKIVLPVKGHRNILITSALPYVNNVPHLGNIIGCVLSADIFARYCRLCDYNTLFVCGTDEYGTATETKALEEGVTPREICDKYFEIHNSVYRWFNIGFDYFGRTSTKEQTEIAQKLFLKLKDNGFVSKQSVEQLFCEKCQRFLADRFVEGTCPHPGCLYESARGDQCDKCGKLINAVELIRPRCKLCSHTPSVKPSEQLFIELNQLEPSLRSWISSRESGWSAPARAVTRAWLREPLRPRAVTRDLKWGVPVPVENFTNKVFYVWFDAPIGYLSITQNACKQYEKWWKPDKQYDVKLYQFMAKDNVPFHMIMAPATMIGVNEGHLLVNHIFATEYLNYEEGKFSKSRGVGVFGTDAQETGISSDVWRFYLASIRPETSDSSFSWVELGTRNNSELLNNLGNFCHRSLSFCANSFKGFVPEFEPSPSDYELIALVNREVIAYVQDMEKGRLREALRRVLSISRLGNQHMQSRQPWALLKGSDDDKERAASTIGLCCQIVATLCTLLTPYMPETGRRLRDQLNLSPDMLRINPSRPSMIRCIPKGHVIGKPEPLFVKLESDALAKLREKYAGTQSERASKENGDDKKAVGSLTVKDLEDAVAKQGDAVRELKAKTKDKSVWQPEVDKLLALKKQLVEAQSKLNGSTNDNRSDLEKAIAEQGEKVRQLKASTKDKSVWQPQINILLDLKKKLASLNVG